TFELCKKFVDDFVLVSEEEIKAGIKFILEKHFQLIEGAAALGIASFFKKKREFKGKNVVIILSGGKISVELLKKIIN
ncbi:MAG: pyridoxal-phosphate dependent enzyme, partial [Candidatus Heimdallarchaeaceae archaeon]